MASLKVSAAMSMDERVRETARVPGEILAFFPHPGNCMRITHEAYNHRACVYRLMKTDVLTAVRVCAYYGYADLLESCLDRLSLSERDAKTLFYMNLESAIRRNHLPCVRVLVDRGAQVQSHHVAYAIRFGCDFECIKYCIDSAVKKNITLELPVMVETALKGNIEVVDYLLSLGHALSSVLVKYAISTCENEYLDHILSLGCPSDIFDEHGYFGDVSISAAKGGNIETLKILFRYSQKRPPEVVNVALARNHAECAWFAVEAGCPVDEHTLSNAMLCGDVSMAKLCLERGYVFSVSGRDAALATVGGHYECLKLAIESGVPVCSEYAEEAARKGHTRCLALLRDSGVEMTPRVTSNAIVSGNVECVAFVLENEFPSIITDALRLIRHK